jgi:hypothetical protein
MRIRVHNAADLPDLVAFLEERECVAEPVGPNTIEASQIASLRHNHVRMEFDLHLQAWLAAHPESQAEILD